jgi:EmrB/QacA subfamily drug resistance transporter
VRRAIRAKLASKPPGYRFTIGRILAIYSGLMVTLLLAALDQTIVATALPDIVSHLGGLGSYTWVFTAYLLASTVTVPLYGKLGDKYGRRPLLLFSITVFLLGSALCGLAQNMTELVAFRVVQGLGAGGLFPLSIAVVGTIVPPRDRGRYQGLIGAVFAAASIIGPAVGGFIVDNASWPWIFYVNLPVGGVALAVVWRTMPRRAPRRDHSVDWVGAAVLAGGTAALLLGLVWGGREYPWGSPEVVGALVASAVLLAVFALVERSVREPILPFDLMRISTVSSSVVCVGLIGMAMFGTIAFVPLFVQGVIGTSVTSSGVVLTPFMLGAVTTSILTGQLVSRTGRYRQNVLFGPVVLCLGMVLLSRMDVSTTNAEAARNMVIAGIGLGSMMQVFVLAVQNSVPVRAMGTATALTQFGRSIGATVGVTVMGAIVNQGLPPAARNEGLATVHRLPLAAREQLASALHPAFLAAAAVCVVVWVVAFLGVKERPLRRGFDDLPAAEQGSPQPLSPPVVED